MLNDDAFYDEACPIAFMMDLRAYMKSGQTDIAPLPGRMVCFFSQEVEHEVLESEGQRFALTVWIWDTKKERNMMPKGSPKSQKDPSKNITFLSLLFNHFLE